MKKNYLVVLLFPFLKGYSQCTPRALPFIETFSVSPMAACTPTTGGWAGTSAASGAGWWVPSPATNYAGGIAPEIEAYGDQSNGGISETIHLTSPPLNTLGTPSVTLSFKHNLYLTSSGASGSNGISISVETSSDNITWSQVYNASYNAAATLTSLINETRTLALTGLGDSTYLRFSIGGVMFKVYGWEIDDINVTAPATTSIHAIKAADVIIYPNPAKELLMVNLTDAQQNKITVYDVVGKIVFQAETTTKQLNIDTKDFLQGVYLLQIQNEAGIVTKKIIKE
jgi:hypothetical protein